MTRFSWQKIFHDKNFSWQDFHDKSFHDKKFHNKNIFMTKFSWQNFHEKNFHNKFSWQKQDNKTWQDFVNFCLGPLKFLGPFFCNWGNGFGPCAWPWEENFFLRSPRNCFLPYQMYWESSWTMCLSFICVGLSVCMSSYVCLPLTPSRRDPNHWMSERCYWGVDKNEKSVSRSLSR